MTTSLLCMFLVVLAFVVVLSAAVDTKKHAHAKHHHAHAKTPTLTTTTTTTKQHAAHTTMKKKAADVRLTNKVTAKMLNAYRAANGFTKLRYDHGDRACAEALASRGQCKTMKPGQVVVVLDAADAHTMKQALKAHRDVLLRKDLAQFAIAHNTTDLTTNKTENASVSASEHEGFGDGGDDDDDDDDDDDANADADADANTDADADAADANADVATDAPDATDDADATDADYAESKATKAKKVKTVKAKKVKKAKTKPTPPPLPTVRMQWTLLLTPTATKKAKEASKAAVEATMTHDERNSAKAADAAKSAALKANGEDEDSGNTPIDRTAIIAGGVAACCTFLIGLIASTAYFLRRAKRNAEGELDMSAQQPFVAGGGGGGVGGVGGASQLSGVPPMHAGGSGAESMNVAPNDPKHANPLFDPAAVRM